MRQIDLIISTSSANVKFFARVPVPSEAKVGHLLFIEGGADFVNPELLKPDTTGVERCFFTTRVSGELVHKSELEIADSMSGVGKVLLDRASEKQWIAGVSSTNVLTKANSGPTSTLR